MPPESRAVHHTRVFLWLPWHTERRAGTGHHQAVARQSQRWTPRRRLAGQLPAFLVFAPGDLRHVSYAELRLYPVSNPLDVLRPFGVRRARSFAIDPVGIA